MNDMSISDIIALRDDKRGDYEYGRHYGNRGVAATGLALGASALGIALFGGFALWGGLNAASKARYDGAMQAQNNACQGTRDMLALLTNRMADDNNRANTINLDVTQTLRSLAAQTATATAQGGSATSQALATAEALALLQNGSSATGVNSAVGGCNYLRVARVSGSQLCGCDTCNG